MYVDLLTGLVPVPEMDKDLLDFFSNNCSNDGKNKKNKNNCIKLNNQQHIDYLSEFDYNMGDFIL